MRVSRCSRWERLASRAAGIAPCTRKFPSRPRASAPPRPASRAGTEFLITGAKRHPARSTTWRNSRRRIACFPFKPGWRSPISRTENASTCASPTADRSCADASSISRKRPRATSRCWVRERRASACASSRRLPSRRPRLRGPRSFPQPPDSRPHPRRTRRRRSSPLPLRFQWIWYTVQAGAFADRDRAEALRATLEEMYADARVVAGTRNLWRVVVGRQMTIDQAGELAARVRKDMGAALVVPEPEQDSPADPGLPQ